MFLRRTAFALLALVPSLVQAAVTVSAAPDVESGVYEVGKNATWNITVAVDGKPAAGKVAYQVQKGGLAEIAKGELELKDGKASVSATRNEPGTLLLTVHYKAGNDKPVRGLGGAAFAPEKIGVSLPPPDDFDAFWNAKFAESDALPLNAKFTPVDVGDKNVEYFKFTLDNINGTKVHGQLAKPAGKSNLPGLLQVQWAGVYPLNRDWVLNHARNGWLAVNITAHDLPIDEPAAFYQQKSSKELNDYPGIGNESRDTSYFLRMFLSCRRAADFITRRPDWNKKTIVVHGGSQGGWQAMVTPALHPAVTALAANVPAGCDHTGRQAGRSPGWPFWANRTYQGKDEKKMLTAARYYDAMNFASRVKCPALIGIGLVDTTCAAEGIFAACNQLGGPKKLVIMARADHGGDHRAYYGAFGAFLEEQKRK